MEETEGSVAQAGTRDICSFVLSGLPCCSGNGRSPISRTIGRNCAPPQAGRGIHSGISAASDKGGRRTAGTCYRRTTGARPSVGAWSVLARPSRCDGCCRRRLFSLRPAAHYERAIGRDARRAATLGLFRCSSIPSIYHAKQKRSLGDQYSIYTS